MRPIIRSGILSLVLCIGLSAQAAAMFPHARNGWAKRWRHACDEMLQRDCVLNVDTPLIEAVIIGDKEAVTRLLQVPAVDVNVKSKVANTTALVLSVANDRIEIATQLLQVPGIDVNAKDLLGWSALRCAVDRGHNDIFIELLHSDGIDVNTKDLEGRTPLMKAVSCDRTEMVTQLLQVPGIDVSAKGNDGKTALDLANNDEIKELLEEYNFKAVAGKIKSGRSGVKKKK